MKLGSDTRSNSEAHAFRTMTPLLPGEWSHSNPEIVSLGIRNTSTCGYWLGNWEREFSTEEDFCGFVLFLFYEFSKFKYFMQVGWYPSGNVLGRGTRTGMDEYWEVIWGQAGGVWNIKTDCLLSRGKCWTKAQGGRDCVFKETHS